MNIKFGKIFFVFLLFFAYIPKTSAAYSPLVGDIVKGSDSAIYYVSASNERKVFPNEETYFSWYSDYTTVKTISDTELALLKLTGLVTVRPGVKIIKIEPSPKVYAVGKGGVLRWITNEEMAKVIFGTDWNKLVINLSEAFLPSYKFGDDITTSGQYWWQKERDSSTTIYEDIKQDTVQTELPVTPPVNNTTSDLLKPEEKNVLYILWDPKRSTHPAPDKTALERVIFGGAPSLSDYYSTESNNHIIVKNAGILGWYSADKSSVHYWSDEEITHDNDSFKDGEVERVAEALKRADADFDFSAYDTNKDGKILSNELGIFIIIPSLDEDAEELVIPYSAELPANVPFEADGIIINEVAVNYLGAPVGAKFSFGSLLRSFAKHVLKLAEISANLNDKFSVGSFSLMSSDHVVSRLDPYNRIALGWATPKVIPKNLEISQQVIGASAPDRQIIRVDRDQPSGPALGQEYFLIENRAQDIYDNSIPDSGIAIWNINGTAIRLLHLDPKVPLNESKTLWHANQNTYEPIGLELNWGSDGVRSGVQLMGLGTPSLSMDFTLSKKILNEIDVRPPLSPIQ